MQPSASAAPLAVMPGTPDSAHIVIDAAGYVALERRQPIIQHSTGSKSLMNCLRDRSSSSSSAAAQYARLPSRNLQLPTLVRVESSGSSTALDAAGRPEAVVLLRELRTRPNKLTLLKSSSSRDLSRLVLDDTTAMSTPIASATALLVSNTSLDVSSNSSSTSSPRHGRERRGSRECCTTCSKHWSGLKQRVRKVEDDLQAQIIYSQELETKLSELSRSLAELTQEKQRNRTKRTTSGNMRTSKLVAWMNLSNWWKSRPSVETLRAQRIFFDEPCFDTELELVLKHDTHRNVPRIVVDCCDLIEQMYRRSSQPVEGIYRQCGDYNKIQTLRFSIDANDYDALHQPNVDIHTLTGVLKLFLREIKSPLISVNEAKTFIGTPHQWLLKELAVKLDTLKRLIRSLPEINRDTMDYIFAHFNRLTKVPLQSISAETLSISITPSIFHTVPHGVNMEDIQQLLREGETLADCAKLMIEYQSRIFECTADRRLRCLSVRNLKKTLSQPDLLFHNIF